MISTVSREADMVSTGTSMTSKCLTRRRSWREWVAGNIPGTRRCLLRVFVVLPASHETKHAVGAGGYWLLYDWNLTWEDDATFKLGSDTIKNKLRAVPLDRKNHPSQFVVAQPQLPSELRVFGSLGEQLRAAHEAHAPKA
ncbi:uncharacterized protein C8Q71DRAFT_437043 [Rhodofomes roseus]|uniref:Uncharacterized protein n=1 Tax=Rhodofomes roseus TaxID=34475 RepID=A0ABQ8KTA1_9APHY|nr:uncharacterized protein C8Q71DRAFT_437043 [Rhodofomes roseus]KAH9841061.1 hypothetical protein C8Q71DRAFT_437043 [Rhodofomes roseus]